MEIAGMNEKDLISMYCDTSLVSGFVNILVFLNLKALVDFFYMRFSRLTVTVVLYDL